jgi:hypothetical protein
MSKCPVAKGCEDFVIRPAGRPTLSTTGVIYAAVVESSGCQYGSQTSVRVLDARSGRTASVTVDAGEGGPSDLQHLGSPVGVGVASLVLDDDGDVAWLGRSAEQKGGPPSETVLYVDDGQGIRRLAAAPSITGLAFRGEQLIWAGGVRSTGCAELSRARDLVAR